jgi:hypothetical protein
MSALLSRFLPNHRKRQKCTGDIIVIVGGATGTVTATGREGSVRRNRRRTLSHVAKTSRAT